jgi:hypothetical protein
MQNEYTGSTSRLQALNPSKNDDVAPSSPIEEKMRQVVRKKGKRRRKSTVHRDRKSLEAIRAYESTAGRGAEPSSVENETPSSSTSSPSHTTGRYTPSTVTEDTLEPENDNLPLKAWRYVTEAMKLAFFTRALPSALAFSLNLAPEFEVRVATKPTWLLKRITREMANRLNGERQVAFVVEEARGRVHVHGVTEACPQEIEAVLASLRAAGGKWAAMHGEKHQAHAEPIFFGDGWARYVCKQLATTRRVTGACRLSAMTRAGTQAARALYEALRQEMKVAAV